MEIFVLGVLAVFVLKSLAVLGVLLTAEAPCQFGETDTTGNELAKHPMQWHDQALVESI